jgi:hypothetical protein
MFYVVIKGKICNDKLKKTDGPSLGCDQEIIAIIRYANLERYPIVQFV